MVTCKSSKSRTSLDFGAWGNLDWDGKDIRNVYDQVPHLSQDTIWEKDKSTRTFPYKRAKMLTLSQQVTTRLQLKYITEGNDKHNYHHLGAVGKKITGEL